MERDGKEVQESVGQIVVRGRTALQLGGNLASAAWPPVCVLVLHGTPACRPRSPAEMTRSSRPEHAGNAVADARSLAGFLRVGGQRAHAALHVFYIYSIRYVTKVYKAPPDRAPGPVRSELYGRRGFCTQNRNRFVSVRKCILITKRELIHPPKRANHIEISILAH